MKLLKITITAGLAAAMWIAPGSALASTATACMAVPTTNWANTKNADQANYLLRDMDIRSARVASTADGLVYTNAPTQDTWQFQTNEIVNIKSDVNQMGKDLCQLEAMRSSLPAWEQTALDRALPRLVGLADNTTDAIKLINTNQHSLWRPELRQYESSVDAQARSLSRMMDEYADYAHVHKRDRQLEKSLEIQTAM